jgi:TRAP-type C4-dicarboxylate transport system permease small subunit
MMIVLSAFLISIRNIGVVFLFSILIDGVVGFYRTRKKNKMGRLNFGSLKFPVMIAFGGFGVYYIFNSLVFKTSGDSVFSYSDIFDFNQCIHTSQNHLNYYLLVFRNYFEPNDGYWNFVSVICGTMFCAFMIIGMIKKVSERIGFVDVLVFLYLGIILIYPYSSGGFRFLLPVIPFLLYYCVLGIKCLNINMGINHHIITIIIGIIILFSYKEQWRNIYQNRNAIVQGPQEKESEEAFDYIRKNIPMDEKIDFTKPRALALYTDHQSMCNLAKLPAADLNDDLLDNKVNYVLINSDIADDSLKAFVLNPEYGMKEVWKNGKFTLFKR